MRHPTRLFRSCLLLLCLWFSTSPVFAETKAETIDRIVKKYHDEGKFDGVVLVADQGKVLYKKAFGKANREWNVGNTTDTRFKIASITKQFTALLVMQLVEEGKLKLDSPVADYLPEYRGEATSKITLNNLLTHTSGLANLDDETGYYQRQDADLLQSQSLLKACCSKAPAGPPGEKFNYNNADFILLGLVLEKVTGKTYEQLLQEKILRPLQMNNTGLATREAVLGKQATGYEVKNAVYAVEPYYRIQNFYSAGAMYSTVDDLFLWNRALDTNKLLSKAATEVMFTPIKSLGFVALGSWAYRLDLPTTKPLLIERQGGIGAFHTLNIRVPERGASLIVLSNLDTSELYTTYIKKGLPFEILQVLLSR